MMRFTALLFLAFLLVACKKDLPKSISPGEYVWVHSYNNYSFGSESYQTIEIEHTLKIKRNGTYIFFQNGEEVVKGKFEGSDYFENLPAMWGYSGKHGFSVTTEGVNIYGYPIINHTNTFLKL